jgi:hypothetical protein
MIVDDKSEVKFRSVTIASIDQEQVVLSIFADGAITTPKPSR